MRFISLIGRALSTFLLLLFSIGAYAQSYGLAFNGHETVQEKRTSLDLTPDAPLCFAQNMRLDFDFSFAPHYQVYFGYILRMLNGDRNIDLIFDQKAFLFRVIAGDRFSGLSFSLDSNTLYNEWNRISLTVLPAAHKMQLHVNNKYIGETPIQFTSKCYQFLWGANDHQRFYTRDIPPMRLRDIHLFDNGKLTYSWPLDEDSAVVILDKVHQQKAVLKEPVWIKPRHRNWTLKSDFMVRGTATAAFDASQDQLFVTSSDSLYKYDFRNLLTPWSKAAIPGASYQTLINGYQAIYDTLTRRLYYIFIDHRKVATYQPATRQWGGTTDSALTEYWHFNKFVSNTDTAIYMVGGYGQLRYRNQVQRYRITTGQWDTLRPGGDYFPPRYLAALGTTPGGDTAYIIGGYGSASGDQMLAPGNYYDLFRFDVRKQSFTKLFSLDSITSKFVFANSLVIDAKNQEYYGLVFPNDSSSTHLSLLKGSLAHGTYQLCSSPIDYYFYDLQSFTDLYYSPGTHQLIAVTLSYPKAEEVSRGNTHVRIYTLDFPPDSDGALAAAQQAVLWPWLLAGALMAVAFMLWLLRRRRSRVAQASMPAQTLVPQPAATSHIPLQETETAAPTRSQILLFGQFQVFDQEGHDITRLFTPVIRELFLLVLIHTERGERGMSSEELNEMLWRDRPVKDAKNNRSVNLAKLKPILEKIGSCRITKDSGFWEFVVNDDAIQVDYENYKQLLRQKTAIDKAFIQRLLAIASRGAFLYQIEYNWLDDIKAEVSNDIITLCLDYLKTQHTADDELTIQVANCIFHFDRLNEDALRYKCHSLIRLGRHALAMNAYSRFVKDYQEIYGEPFGKPFAEMQLF